MYIYIYIYVYIMGNGVYGDANVVDVLDLARLHAASDLFN